jgi:hypothetical protein
MATCASEAPRRGRTAAARAVRLRIARPGSRVVFFGLPLAVYLGLGAYLDLVQHAIVGDAWSRVGNAYYVLFSRDPHLAAIGFAWNPLPSMLEMPLVLLKGVWPALVTDGYAASIVSALAMAGTVYQLRAALADWEVSPRVRDAVTLLFALHPLIIYFGANGDSEALFLLCLALTARWFARWLRDNATFSLAMAGLAIGVTYLVRYEAGSVALFACAAVAVVSYARSTGALRLRAMRGAADSLIVGLPFGFTFAAWAVASWVITGDPFEQFFSPYSPLSQVRAANQEAQGSLLSRLAIANSQLSALEPAIPLLLGVAIGAALWRRDARLVAPMTVYGGVLAFVIMTLAAGQTAVDIRYMITVIPLATLLAGCVLGRLPRPLPPDSRRARFRGALESARFGLVSFASIACLAIALPVATYATFASPAGASGDRVGWEGSWGGGQIAAYVEGAQIAADLDARDLPAGSVLLDTVAGFPVVLESRNPAQFVITSDRDFELALAVPAAFGVRYILVPRPQGIGTLDASNRRWPGLFETGAGIGQLVRVFPVMPEGVEWRLYAVHQPAYASGAARLWPSP